MATQSMNLVISATFLSLMQAATPSGAFGLYAGELPASTSMGTKVLIATLPRLLRHRMAVLRFLLSRDERVGPHCFQGSINPKKLTLLSVLACPSRKSSTSSRMILASRNPKLFELRKSNNADFTRSKSRYSGMLMKYEGQRSLSSSPHHVACL